MQPCFLTDQNRCLQHRWTTTDFKVGFHWTYEQFRIYSSAAVMAVQKHPWNRQLFSKEKACCSKKVPKKKKVGKICIELSHKIHANTGPGRAVGTCRRTISPGRDTLTAGGGWTHTGVWERLLQIPVTPSVPGSGSKEEIFVRASVH